MLKRCIDFLMGRSLLWRSGIFTTGFILGGVLTLSVFLATWGVAQPPEASLPDFRPHPLPVIPNPKAAIGVIGHMAFYVSSTDLGSPAHKAGLQQGDLIIGLNGHSIEAIDDYLVPILTLPPGQKHDIYFYRPGRPDPGPGERLSQKVEVISVPWVNPASLPPSSGGGRGGG